MTDARYKEICRIMNDKTDKYRYCFGNCPTAPNQYDMTKQEWEFWKSKNPRKYIKSKDLNCKTCR